MGRRGERVEPALVEVKVELQKLVDSLLLASWSGGASPDLVSPTADAHRLWALLPQHEHQAVARSLVQQTLTVVRPIFERGILWEMYDGETSSSSSKRRVIRQWLSVLETLFEPDEEQGNPGAFIRELNTALWALESGEISEIVRLPDGSRRSGKRTNSFTLATCQIQAIFWKESLPSFGVTAAEADKILHDSFGLKWDTMRKWDEGCREALGPRIGQALEAEHRRFVDTLRDWPLSDIKVILKLLGQNYLNALKGEEPAHEFAEQDATHFLEIYP